MDDNRYLRDVIASEELLERILSSTSTVPKPPTLIFWNRLKMLPTFNQLIIIASREITSK